MKKIVTALCNPKVNKELLKTGKYELITNDISSQEDLIEILDSKAIDVVILNISLQGNLSKYELLEAIIKKHAIKIITILEEKDEEYEQFLRLRNISDILYDKYTNINEIMECIDRESNVIIKREVPSEILEELEKLKHIIENKKTTKIKNFIKEKFKKIPKDNVLPKKYKKKWYKFKFLKNRKTIDNQIISITGIYGAGKTSFAIYLSKILSNDDKVLIVDWDEVYSNIEMILNLKNKNNYYNELRDYIVNYKKTNIDVLPIKNLINTKDVNFKEIISKIYEMKNRYKLIIFDISTGTNNSYINQILEITNQNIFILKPNLIDLSKSSVILQKYINEWKVKEESLYIVFNKKSKYSIDIAIIKKVLYNLKILGLINYHVGYENFLSTHKRLVNRKIKKEYGKIIRNLK